MKTYVSLKELVEQLTALLAQHPDAETTQEPEQFDDGYNTVIQWWVPLSESDPIVADLLWQAKAAEEQQRKYDEQELKRLKTQRPDLFGGK